jgi:hypothetical protein
MPLPYTPETTKASDRPWSEEVRRAEATDPLPAHDTAYEFSNGKRFRQPQDTYGAEEEA